MRASEKDIEIKVVGEIDRMISADSRRLDQLFVNLLENALAYTDSPGRIEISLVRYQRQCCHQDRGHATGRRRRRVRKTVRTTLPS